METHFNRAFTLDNGLPSFVESTQSIEPNQQNPSTEIVLNGLASDPPDETISKKNQTKERELWSKDIEFLLSCIAMSVGLGNVWRFPFTALENGGGAFLIPYLIVLFLVGKPIYYLEMLIGQFSSRGSVKVFDLCPAMRGIGYGQVISIAVVTTYYASLMGLTLKYFFSSFQTVLPWSVCNPDWDTPCIPSGAKNVTIRELFHSNVSKPSSSAELYFIKEILKEKDSIHDGIGTPNWQLAICLIVAWSCVYVILIKGVRSSGKASYFLAIFPYIVLTILLVRACTLEGAANGIFYFIRPQWDQILNPKVWYAAVTQVFFSLSVCFGNIIMYSSYNKFGHNVHRDATIVTLLDTFTSLLAGFTIFGILGHLAHEIGTDDIGSVVKGGTGLAFISYPDAISKFQTLPQAFAVLFFAMLFVLGVGSNIAMTSCVMTAIRDNFPKVKNYQAALAIAVVSIGLGLSYVTPGGQFILNLVDYYGASIIALVLAIAELITLGWIYGVNQICRDTEFMIGKNPNLYWRLCWGIITPLMMTAILIYFFVAYEPLTYRDYVYTDGMYSFGWCISALGMLQVPIWMIVAIYKQEGNTILNKIVGAFQPRPHWGPKDEALLEKYKKFLATDENSIKFVRTGLFYRAKRNIFG